MENELTPEEIIKQIEEYEESIKNLSIEELMTKMEDAIKSTDLILEGYNLVTNISEGHGIAVAGILKLRETILETMDWLDFNLIEEEEEENTVLAENEDL